MKKSHLKYIIKEIIKEEIRDIIERQEGNVKGRIKI